jgi:DEAD/DEAH box helicase domain-containing protein
MLHAGILPNHPKWHRFFSNLKFVVIDETHIYRGLFGSHMANLLRRFQRILEFYGSSPTFIFCSATIGNPGSLAARLLGRDVRVIDNNGAPRSRRHLILFNPPLIDPVQGLRRSTVLEAQRLALLFLGEKIKTIVFARSRQRSELIASYLNQSLKNIYTDNARTRVESYRGGYLPSERREVEKGLRDGSIMGVVSTNALELGIDIGGLDVSIMAGFPGTLASFWQQSGRSGRRSGESVSILIASNSPMDQFLVTNPSYIEKSSVEQAYIDPDNVFILMDHLKCSAFEKPFDEGESVFPEGPAFLSHLESQGLVRLTGGKYYFSASGYPAESVSLRSASQENVVIINTTGGKNEVIGEMDKPSAKEMLFPNAVYLHRGEQFMVEVLDIENKQARVKESDVNYYTDSVVKSDIKVLTEEDRLSYCRLDVCIGDLLVRSQVSKFKKIKFHTHENLGYGDIFLPEEELHTRGLALIFDPKQSFGISLANSSDALKPKILFALGHMILNIAPLFLYCDRGDLAVSERIRDPHYQEPVLFIYERCPGGCGLSEGLLTRLKDVLLAVRSRLRECPCSGGCPSCVGAVEPSDVREGLKKIVGDIVTGALEGLE